MRELSWLIILCCTLNMSFGQNHLTKWYFGNKVGLDFMTSPPTVITTSQMNNFEGCSSIADSSGNLLFYTDGLTIWNKMNVVMANGSGLFANISTTQAALIVQKPGSSTIYYIFTNAAIQGLYYSVVDVSLAAGMGSVTVKNTLLDTLSTEKLCGTYHCNGVDIWILTHEPNSNKYIARLLTASGINSSIVLSSIGSIDSNYGLGYLKFSLNGKKVAATVGKYAASVLEVFDFNNLTGVLSNSLSISSPQYGMYSCEFSPDASKLYRLTPVSNPRHLIQWDLCAGDSAAVAASRYDSIVGFGAGAGGAIQIAPDGKIYCIRVGDPILGIINNPNEAGVNCNYIDTGQSIAPKYGGYGLPNMVIQAKLSPFTYTTACQTTTFAGLANTSTNCAATGTPSSIKWNFGDPVSASSNTSTLLNPTHIYSSVGTFTAQLIISYPCYTDTISQAIIITNVNPNVTLMGPSNICKGETHTLTVSNSIYSYSWAVAPSPTSTPTYSINNVSSLIINPSSSTYYQVTASDTLLECIVQKSILVVVNECLDFNSESDNQVGSRIYPNPAHSLLQIEVMEAGTEILIYNQLGQLVTSAKTKRKNCSIDVKEFPAGAYYIKVRNKGSEQIHKFLKQQD